jgi:hypothetical protein
MQDKRGCLWHDLCYSALDGAVWGMLQSNSNMDTNEVRNGSHNGGVQVSSVIGK